MCSIFGILDYEGKAKHSLKEKLIQNLAIAAEIRGTDATGISYVQDGSIVIYKEPKAAHEVKLNFPNGTKVVMGHTRMATQGSELRNYNNHPFNGCCGQEEFALAHNGILYNDRELREEKNLPPTCIETDSYIAVQLLERSSELNMENVKSMAETIQGSFMITILRNDNTMFFARGDNPIVMYYIPELGIYAYASTAQILNDALKETGINGLECEIVRITTEEIVAISEDSIVREDFTENRRYGGYNYSYGSYYRGHGGSYGYGGYYGGGCYGWDLDDEEEPTSKVKSTIDLLYEYGNLYGIDRMTIDALLEYGFDADIIEEMFYDKQLFNMALEEIRSCKDVVYI